MDLDDHSVAKWMVGPECGGRASPALAYGLENPGLLQQLLRV